MVKNGADNFINLYSPAAFSSLKVVSVAGRTGNFLLGSAHS